MWRGRSVYLIGGGPSLVGFDFTVLRGCGVVVAINDAILHAPWADACFSIDTMWMDRRHQELLAFRGERILAVPPAWKPREPSDKSKFTVLRRIDKVGISPIPATVYTGKNSGFAALGLAMTRRARRIALLGYDMTGPGHWHKGYEWHCRYGPSHYQSWASFFDRLAHVAKKHRIEVVNCNPRSRINCFPFAEWQTIAEQGPEL